VIKVKGGVLKRQYSPGYRRKLRGIVLSGVVLLSAFSIDRAGFVAPAHAIDKSPLKLPKLRVPVPGTRASFVADRVEYDPATKTAIARGTVELSYGIYRLTASEVSMNETTGAFSANGSVVILAPGGNSIEAASIDVRDKFKTLFAESVKAIISNRVELQADTVRRTEDGKTVFTNAHYTACLGCRTRNGEPMWELVTEKTTHDQTEHMLHHVKPKFKIAGHTVVSLPKLSLPDPTVKRKTGFLRPEYKAGTAYGLQVITPYFWATAPNHDLTFRPAIATHQGPLGDVEWRHRLESGQYNVRGYGVYQRNPGDTLEPGRRVRGALQTRGTFKLNDTLTWGWQGTIATDRNVLHEYDLDETRIAKNNVWMKNLSDRNYVSAEAIQFASKRNFILQERMPTALPYVSGEHYFNDPVLGGELKFNWNTYALNRELAYVPFVGMKHGKQQLRAVGDVRWSKQMINDSGMVFTPFGHLKSDVHYSEDVSAAGAEDTTFRFLPSAGLDFRMPFISNTRFGQSILSPVMQIIAAPDETGTEAIGNEDALTLNFDHTSLFLDDRFTGLDRYEGGVRANVGVNYTLLGANGGYLRASVGESFHLAGKNSFADGSGLEGSGSDIVGALTWRPNEFMGLSYEARVEEDLSAINRQSLQAGLTLDRFAGDVSYAFIAAEPAYGRPKDEEWISTNARLGLTDSWYLFGGVQYNIAEDLFNRRTLGLEFDCECMNFKMAYTAVGGAEFLGGITDHRFLLSFDFATLGGGKISGHYKPN
jgi:LPS-assembly protein